MMRAQYTGWKLKSRKKLGGTAANCHNTHIKTNSEVLFKPALSSIETYWSLGSVLWIYHLQDRIEYNTFPEFNSMRLVEIWINHILAVWWETSILLAHFIPCTMNYGDCQVGDPHGPVLRTQPFALLTLEYSRFHRCVTYCTIYPGCQPKQGSHFSEF